MTTHPGKIRLGADFYELLVREATRRGVEPDALADELLRVDPGGARGDLEHALSALADLRATLPDIDAVALTRGARRA